MPVMTTMKISVGSLATARLQYKISSKGSGKGGSLRMEDTFNIPEICTDLDLAMCFEPAGSQDQFAITGVEARVSSGVNTWTFSAGTDTLGEPSMSMMYEGPTTAAAASGPTAAAPVWE